MNTAGASRRVLRFAARPRALVGPLADVVLALGLLLMVPAGVCLADGQDAPGRRLFAVASALIVLGAVARRMPPVDRLQRNEALVVSALAFVVPPLLLAWPLAGFGLRWNDAWFEAVSGLTSTGLTVVDGLAERPLSLLFLRAWLQWIGGLGVVVLVLALLTHPGPAARHLGFGRREVDDVAGGTRDHARRVARIYGLMTLAGFALLWALTGQPVQALLLTLSAVSTGGFSGHDRSLAVLDGPAQAAVMAMCLAGAVAFYTYYRPVFGGWRRLVADSQLRALLTMTVLVSLLLWIFTPATTTVGEALVMGLSAQTTAGFSVVGTATLPPIAQLLLVVAMATGGAVGSTAGGIKLLRLLVLLQAARLLFARLATPASAWHALRVGGRRVHAPEIETVVGLLGCWLLALLLSWAVFLAHGTPPMAALFEVTSALATAGLSAGVTSSSLDPVLKAVLCLDMTLGRVEVLALVVLLLPRTWFGRRRRLR